METTLATELSQLFSDSSVANKICLAVSVPDAETF